MEKLCRKQWVPYNFLLNVANLIGHLESVFLRTLLLG